MKKHGIEARQRSARDQERSAEEMQRRRNAPNSPDACPGCGGTEEYPRGGCHYCGRGKYEE